MPDQDNRSLEKLLRAEMKALRKDVMRRLDRIEDLLDPISQQAKEQLAEKEASDRERPRRIRELRKELDEIKRDYARSHGR